MHPKRAEKVSEAKRLAAAARNRANVSFKALGDVLFIHEMNVARKLDAGHQHFVPTYADMLMMAEHVDTAEFVRLLIAPLLDRVDHRNLRLQDLEAMASSTATADIARIAARGTAALLWPEKFADTANQASSTEE